jgi:hypothetical protein
MHTGREKTFTVSLRKTGFKHRLRSVADSEDFRSLGRLLLAKGILIFVNKYKEFKIKAHNTFL